MSLQCHLLSHLPPVPNPPKFTPGAVNSSACRHPAGIKPGKLGGVRLQWPSAHAVSKHLLKTRSGQTKQVPACPRATSMPLGLAPSPTSLCRAAQVNLRPGPETGPVTPLLLHHHRMKSQPTAWPWGAGRNPPRPCREGWGSAHIEEKAVDCFRVPSWPPSVAFSPLTHVFWFL